MVLVATAGAATDIPPLGPGIGTNELGSEVLGGRRLVKAAVAATAVTAPCGSGLPPRLGVATPPTGGTRGAGVGTSPVASAVAGGELSSLQVDAAVAALMPDDI